MSLAGGQPILVPHKVTSHLDESCIGTDITAEEYILNGVADKLAELAVRQFDYPTDLGMQVELHEK